MRVFASCRFDSSVRATRRARAFSLSEMMVAMALFMMVLAGLVGANLFGIRMFELAKAKLGASDAARISISKLCTEIRSAKSVKIGNGDEDNFTEIAVDYPQQGNAIQLYPSLDMSKYVRYYRDESDKTLKRITNGSAVAVIMARSVSNHMVFTAEDYTGTVLTNNMNNRVIGVTLQFFQIAYPIINIGPGNYYDFYQLRSRITRRVLE